MYPALADASATTDEHRTVSGASVKADASAKMADVHRPI
jgi:hypothetical protein